MKNNIKSTGHLNQIWKLLLMSTFYTPEKYVSNVDRNADMRKILTSFIKSSSTLFIVQYVQCIIEFNVLKINVSCWSHLLLKSTHQFFPGKNQENIYSEKLINELHAWIEHHSHNTFPQYKRLSVCQNNVILVKKQKHLLQISVRQLQNDMILPSSERGFSGARKKWKYLYRRYVTYEVYSKIFKTNAQQK